MRQLGSLRKATLCLLILLMPSLAAADDMFDGVRKGITLEFGFGFAPVTHWSVADRLIERDGNSITMIAGTGYAWTNRDMVLLSLNISGRHIPDWNEVWLAQQLFGVTYYRYFQEKWPGPFVCGGVGIIECHNYDNGSFNKGTGVGYTIGVGWELFKYGQIGIHYYGGTADIDGVSARNDVIQLLATGVLF